VRPCRPAADRTVVAHLVRRLGERGVPVVLGAARSAPQRHMAHAPAAIGCLACWAAHTRQPRDFLRHTCSKRMSVRTVVGLVREEWRGHPMMIT
jgi:hypothetical protein